MKLSTIMSVVMPNVVMLSVTSIECRNFIGTLSVIMLSVVVPFYIHIQL